MEVTLPYAEPLSLPPATPPRLTGPGPTLLTSARVISKFLSLVPRFTDADALLREAGLTRRELENPEGRLPVSVLLHLWDAAANRVQRYDLGLLATELYEVADYGLLGFVCMNSQTLREALDAVVRYSRLWTDEPRWHLLSNGGLRLEYRSGFPPGLGLRSATEAALVEVVHGARLLLQRPELHAQVTVRHSAPPDPGPQNTFFGRPVHFGAAENELHFDPADLDRPVPGSGSQLGEFLRQLANRTLEEQGGFVEKVRQVVGEALLRGSAPEAVVARKLAVSTRTLRRNLQDAGTTFREVFSRARYELAQDYLRNKSLPFSEVAFLVGFQDPSAFFRAFRRWSGRTPREFRDGSPASSAPRRHA